MKELIRDALGCLQRKSGFAKQGKKRKVDYIHLIAEVINLTSRRKALKSTRQTASELEIDAFCKK